MSMIECPVLREYLFFTPDKLGGQAAYEQVCAVTGLKPFAGGYGVLLLASAGTGVGVEQHATFVTWNVEWVKAIAEVWQQVVAGTISREAGEVDLSHTPLRQKMAALYLGWPDEWGGGCPHGAVVADYRGALPPSDQVPCPLRPTGHDASGADPADPTFPTRAREGRQKRKKAGQPGGRPGSWPSTPAGSAGPAGSACSARSWASDRLTRSARARRPGEDEVEPCWCPSSWACGSSTGSGRAPRPQVARWRRSR
ncbi:hypothetical protein ACQEU3_45845 [Spirillospora sp. CA-253888]